MYCMVGDLFEERGILKTDDRRWHRVSLLKIVFCLGMEDLLKFRRNIGRITASANRFDRFHKKQNIIITNKTKYTSSIPS